MAKPTYLIKFEECAGAETIHRIRNLAEDVFRALQEDQLGDVPNMDTATNEVHVEVTATRYLGRVRRIITLLLRKHNFPDAVISRQ